MNLKQKILSFLIENKTESFSINEISKKVNIDYKLAYINVQKLIEDKIISVKDFGNAKRCSFEDNLNNDVFIAENERKNQILDKKEFRAIHDKLKRINKQFILLLFGSYAKETATKKSDIDLLLISNQNDTKIIEEKLEVLPIKIHLTAISYESFISMLKSKEQTVVSEALKNNIILFGIEDYYRMIENAK